MSLINSNTPFTLGKKPWSAIINFTKVVINFIFEINTGDEYKQVRIQKFDFKKLNFKDDYKASSFQIDLNN